MLLYLNKHHNIIPLVPSNDVNFKALVPLNRAGVAINYLKPVSSEILDRNILAPFAVGDANVVIMPQPHLDLPPATLRPDRF